MCTHRGVCIEISAGPIALQKPEQDECDHKVSLHAGEVRFAVWDVIKRGENTLISTWNAPEMMPVNLISTILCWVSFHFHGFHFRKFFSLSATVEGKVLRWQCLMEYIVPFQISYNLLSFSLPHPLFAFYLSVVPSLLLLLCLILQNSVAVQMIRIIGDQ